MTELSGLRVLVVEDEGIVAMLIEGMLQDLGCEVTASVGRLAEACSIAATAEIDLAVLDVNLNGQPVLPAAEILRKRRIPCIFTTGYGASGLPSEFTGHPVLGKPYSIGELQKTLKLALERS